MDEELLTFFDKSAYFVASNSKSWVIFTFISQPLTKWTQNNESPVRFKITFPIIGGLSYNDSTLPIQSQPTYT